MFNKYRFVNEWRNSYTRLILVLGFYSGLSGRVRTVYHFSLCVVSLLSSRFTASALVWFYNFLKYLVFHFFISLSTVFMDPVVVYLPRSFQDGSESPGLEALEDFDVGIGGCSHS
jgi:hypothetical protein